MEDFAIKVENVSKTFKLPHEKQSSLKSMFVNVFRSKRGYELQKALNDVSFEIKKGEFFGIVGRNGSGKSTILKLLAGIYVPTSGQVQVNGKLTPFIELGVGFNPELTGRENVFLNGALLGFNRREMQSKYSDIVEFAELQKFMDQKLKNYSSGMQVRLAFSIAIRAQSDILLIDEVLAVGDAIFQKKCYDYFKLLKKQKKTVVFVSHDSTSLLEYCDRGVLIDEGRLVTVDKIDRVVNGYLDILNFKEDAAEAKEDEPKKRWGRGDAVVKNVTTYAKGSKAKAVFTDDDQTVLIRVAYKAKKTITDPVYGIIITDQGDHRVFVSNTLLSKVKTADLAPKAEAVIEWRVPNVFNSGTFLIAPAIANEDGSIIYDWIEAAGKFRVRKKLQSAGFINAEHDIVSPTASLKKV
jgi:ABC-2 type transport system ATP-binding protein